LYCIGGRDATDVWFGGWNGQVIRYDGQSFVNVSAGLPSNFAVMQIAPIGPSEAWALGTAGASPIRLGARGGAALGRNVPE
jgi:hypothetical protein